MRSREQRRVAFELRKRGARADAAGRSHSVHWRSPLARLRLPYRTCGACPLAGKRRRLGGILLPRRAPGRRRLLARPTGEGGPDGYGQGWARGRRGRHLGSVEGGAPPPAAWRKRGQRLRLRGYKPASDQLWAWAAYAPSGDLRSRRGWRRRRRQGMTVFLARGWCVERTGARGEGEGECGDARAVSAVAQRDSRSEQTQSGVPRCWSQGSGRQMGPEDEHMSD